MGIFSYLKKMSIDKLIVLNGELVYLLKLDEHMIIDNNYHDFIHLANEIKIIIEQLKTGLDLNKTTAALLQLVKISYTHPFSNLSHLKKATFYKEWSENGYIEELYNLLT